MADVKKIIKGVFDLPEHLIEAVAPLAYSPEVLNSTMRRLADKISGANPKMSEAEVLKRATTQATKKLDWERIHKPALQKTYGDLADASYSESAPSRLRNTPQVVEERKRKANEFLDQPTEPWVPPKPELQAFDRSSIKDALEGFPGVEQSSFPRDIPTRANISHVEELYNDPENRELIKKQIMRGLPLGGESFYASLYPIKQAVLEAGMPVSKFDSWIHSLAPASARNSIMNEMAVGQFLRNMNAQGLPLDEATVAKQMAEFKKQFGKGLPLMPIHRTGVQNVLENNVNLREHNLANIPTNYKIPTYGTQKAGDFAHSVVLDVHEAAGQSQGSRYHPYFNEAGGFGNTEYNAGEQGMLGIAKELGLPGGMAQAGRWFGGGELTGLRSPRGDALDLLEKQYAYTLQQQGKQPNPANIRAEVLKQIETGEGTLLPWYKKEGMPDVRTTGLQRKDGGQVEHMQAGGVKKAIGALGELVQSVPKINPTAVLSQAEREANLTRFMEGSVVPTVYHSTTQDFNKFLLSKAGSNTKHPTAKLGIFSSADPSSTDDFITSRFNNKKYETGANVMPLHMSIKNPFELSSNDFMLQSMALQQMKKKDANQFIQDFMQSVKDEGHDGLLIKSNPKGLARGNEYSSDNYVAFDPKQIKSSIGNRGTYDPNDPDITKADGGKVEHMQAGGLKTLMGEVLNRGGAYAARRLERAADEIPNLEKLFQKEALKSAFLGDNARAVMTIKPSDFEKYAAPLGSGLSDRSLQNIANLQNIQNNGGFSDVPYLNINKKEQGTMGLPYISGHEGRHRNRAMDAAGEQAGLVQLVPRSELREPFPRRSKEEYLEALYKEMQLTGNRVKPEAYYLDPRDEKTYQRRAVELPEFYAEGGQVRHFDEGGDIMRQLFDHALDNGDIHEMTHAMLVKQHEAEHG